MPNGFKHDGVQHAIVVNKIGKKASAKIAAKNNPNGAVKQGDLLSFVVGE